MKRYHLRPFCRYYQLVLSTVFAIIILIVLGFTFLTEESFFDPVMIFLFAIPFIFIGTTSIAMNIHSANQVNITILDKGIRWYQAGFTYWIKWENIEKISKRTYRFSIQEGLVIKKWSVRFGKRKIGNAIRPMTPFIPLSCYSEDWRTSELGQQIKEYAPRLFK